MIALAFESIRSPMPVSHWCMSWQENERRATSRLTTPWTFFCKEWAWNRRRIAPGMDVTPIEFPKIGDMASPYMAYRELVLKKFPEKMDESRRDAMLALYMRVAGYTRPNVANEMR